MILAAVYDYPILTASILVAVGTIGKSMHWVYHFSKRIESSVSFVEAEMRFNGGTTMRDAVRRIEIRLDTIEHNQEESP